MLAQLVLVVAAYGCSASESATSGGARVARPGTAGASTDQAASGSAGRAPEASAGAAATAGSGAPSAARGTGGEGAESCAPIGSTRVCCDVGLQTCGGIEFGLWGPCMDSGGAAVRCDEPCGAGEFAAGCDAGPPDAGTPDSGTPDSGPPDTGDAGPPGCGATMECKPGSIRYCDVVGIEWSKSQCDATGHWGECVAATVPQGAIGCSQNDYAPELCCPLLFLCCQDNPNGPFVDFGSGACASIACP